MADFYKSRLSIILDLLGYHKDWFYQLLLFAFDTLLTLMLEFAFDVPVMYAVLHPHNWSILG
jgi:hypothetical protein